MDKPESQTVAEVHAETINNAMTLAASEPEKALTTEVYKALAALSAKPETTGKYMVLLKKLAASNDSFSIIELRKQVGEFQPKSTESDEPDDELVTGVDPWHEPVNGDELARSIQQVIKCHCVLSDHSVTASVLWVVSSYAINSFRIFPKMGVCSPQKRCGKTTYLETISTVCNRSLLTSNISAAVLFRVIEQYQPTLIIDEMDTFLDGNDALRGIINSGHTRKAAFVMRVEGDSHDVKRFSTWTPNILAKIGEFPDTIADRLIGIELQRKLPADVVTKLPIDLDEINLHIRRKCQRWVDDNDKELSQSDPKIPNVQNDRAMDNWLPLLAVAELIGGSWPSKARQAMQHIESRTSKGDSDDLSITLLKDIRALIEKKRWHKIVHSATLVECLNSLDERPWPTLRNDKGISANKLAELLRQFKVKSGSKRDPATGGNLKGYSIAQLTEVFDRYLLPETPFQSVTPSQPSNHVGFSDLQSVTPVAPVTDQKPPKRCNHVGCDVVTVEKGFPANDTPNSSAGDCKKSVSSGRGGIL